MEFDQEGGGRSRGRGCHQPKLGAYLSMYQSLASAPAAALPRNAPIKLFRYWGAVSATTATRLLSGREPGTFLIRDSHCEHSIFAVSYRTDKGVYHSRIARFNGQFCLGGPNALIRSASLIDFVEQAMRSSMGSSAEGGAAAHPLRILMHPSSSDPSASSIQMRLPLRRNEFMPSLKHICRLAIRQSLRQQDVSLVGTLPLPKKLKRYVASHTYLNVCQQ